MHVSRWLIGIALVGSVTQAFESWAATGKPGPDFPTLPATPPGITLQRIAEATQGKVSPFLPRSKRKVAYADARGMTLYTYEGKSRLDEADCISSCKHQWIAAAAPRNAQAVGKWSLLGHGAQRWAYGGRPLYTLTNVMTPESAQPASGGGAVESPRVDLKPGDANGSGDWHAVMVSLDKDVPLPPGIAVREVSNAGGQSLVDTNSKTIYYRVAETVADRATCGKTPACSGVWKPVPTSAIARPVGQFAPLRRDDGVTQWTLAGHALYTFDGDVEPGDANGNRFDRNWRAAVVLEYFLPPEVVIADSVAHGAIFTTKEGMTLYKQDAYKFGAGEYGFFNSMPTRPKVGREIGALGCKEECLSRWKPLEAAADAEPSGYWEILRRENGTRQWIYQGYPLYTFSGDRRAGDVTGNEVYDFIVSDDPLVRANTLTYMEGSGAFVWTYVSP